MPRGYEGREGQGRRGLLPGAPSLSVSAASSKILLFALPLERMGARQASTPPPGAEEPSGGCSPGPRWRPPGHVGRGWQDEVRKVCLLCLLGTSPFSSSTKVVKSFTSHLIIPSVFFTAKFLEKGGLNSLSPLPPSFSALQFLPPQKMPLYHQCPCCQIHQR